MPASHDKPGSPARGPPTESDNKVRPAPTKTRRLCRRRITQPEPGSLYDILHDHAGTSLFVVPICWTDRHSNLLGARFVKRATVVKPVPELVPGVWLEPSKMAQTLTSELHTLVREDATPARAFCKNRAMKHILSTLFPATLGRPKTGAELNLYFGHRVFRKVVRIPCIWKSPNSLDTSFDSCPTLPSSSFAQVAKTGRDAGMPMLAYINKCQLAAIRKNLYGVLRGPDNNANEPVSSLQRLRSKMLVPADANHDPYIVAILLAMAQAHFYHESSSRSSSQSSSQGGRKSVRIAPPSFRDVKVQVITHDEGSDSDPKFVVYTPLHFVHPVNFWPILGLKERLSKALGREIAGDSIYDNPDFIGLWDPLLEPQPQPRPVYHHHPVTLKRRRADREPLSQVLNSSFEDDPPSSADDRPVLSPAAKRRRTARRSARWRYVEVLEVFGLE
ncbi:hypothetical protein NEMBOFW57_009262 [Staphylotrichum longicolle]|uniref:Uncharacterized protein n=1 Tax=Staphylotrichum longicolle TaxID=669026 RepID=A0AAD4ENT3_9PEZI|nr:hypothetical protein NEMBOFW57_009262 [Staphylotrichum longicolle]